VTSVIVDKMAEKSDQNPESGTFYAVY